jgi:hypothetical protein
MNRSDRRAKEKSQKRSHNDDVASPKKPSLDRAEMSKGIQWLLDKATPDMQRELDLTLDPKCPPVSELVMLVIDGTSPLAVGAPPELKQAGHNGYAARLVNRSAVFTWLAEHAPSIAKQLAEPLPCGHLAFLASTKDAGAVECVTCERGLTPKVAKPS